MHINKKESDANIQNGTAEMYDFPTGERKVG